MWGNRKRERGCKSGCVAASRPWLGLVADSLTKLSEKFDLPKGREGLAKTETRPKGRILQDEKTPSIAWYTRANVMGNTERRTESVCRQDQVRMRD